MLKKYIAFLFLSFAYALLLGHNIIPHHHHYTGQHHSHYHDESHDYAEPGYDDQDNNGHETNDLSHFFSFFFHSADGIEFSKPVGNSLSSQGQTFTAILPDNFFSNEVFVPPLHYKPPADFLIYLSPQPTLVGLRAPPAFYI